MKKADKPADNSSVNKPAGFKTAQAATNSAVEKVKASDKSSKQHARPTNVNEKNKKAVLTSTTASVEKRRAKTTKKTTSRSTTISASKKTRVKSASKKLTSVPDLNNPGYPLHPTRIWPD